MNCDVPDSTSLYSRDGRGTIRTRRRVRSTEKIRREDATVVAELVYARRHAQGRIST